MGMGNLNHMGVAAGVHPCRLHVGRDGWWPGAVYQRTEKKAMLENTQVSDPQVPANMDLVVEGPTLHFFNYLTLPLGCQENKACPQPTTRGQMTGQNLF